MNANPASAVAQADFQAVIEHVTTGKPLDPQVRERILERSRKAQEELLKSHGIQDIGVSIIREIRGDEDE